MNVNIRNALDPLSLQDYVALRKVMIKLEYQRMLLLLREEEQLHLEALEREAKEICEELKESVFRMSQYRESLKETYGELTELCHKPDMELLQVRKEGIRERNTLLDECCNTEILPIQTDTITDRHNQQDSVTIGKLIFLE